MSVPICPSCATENPDAARFCLACGTRFEEQHAPREETRKVVTVLFADVTGSTSLGERMDPESLRRVMSRYFDEARGALQRHGGTVEKFIGDAVMAVFGIPTLHEDDALRAVRAACELRERLGRLNETLERDYGTTLAVRIGVNTGEVVAGDPSAGQAFVTGDTVNVAQRLEAAAEPGQILIGEPTRLLVRDAVDIEPLAPLVLKGKSEAVPAFRLLSVSADAPGYTRRLESPLVGRGREQALLVQAFERAADERACHLFTVLGPAGIGKSRLAQELVTQTEGRATALTGRCLPYGEGITYWPLLEIVQELGSESELVDLLGTTEDAPLIVNRVVGAIGLADTPTSAEETFWAVRKLFEALARERPLIVVFDDIHWAEPTLLDLIEHIADWSREAPIVVLCLARPDLLELRPGWGGGKMNATSILLEPLSTEESELLVDNIVADAAPETRARVAEAAEGNPLFVEQMLAMVAEAGGELTVPPTITALLAARIDRLPRGERVAIEAAAVIGREFWRGAVVELSGNGADAGPALQGLVRKELVRPHRTLVPGDDGFRFRHQLIRDVAYEGISKEARAELHERFAVWVEGRRSEYDEIVGYHLEQAYRYREQLGPVDDDARTLARTAAARLASAGERAWNRYDFPAATTLLERAGALLPERDPRRIELGVEVGVLRFLGRRTDDALALLDELAETARALGDLRLESRAAIEAYAIRLVALSWTPDERSRLKADAVAAVDRAIEIFEATRDELGLVRAWRIRASLHFYADELAAAERGWETALAYARRVRHVREENEILGRLAQLAVLGATPVEAAVARLTETLARPSTNQLLRARCLRELGALEAMRGRFDDARRHVEDARVIFTELGDPISITENAGYVELLAGDFEAAERQLRHGYDALEARGETNVLCTMAATLAIALLEQGRDGEAEQYTEISERTTPHDDRVTQAMWRATRARVLARRGELEAAERLAREAVGVLADSESIVDRGGAALALAEVLQRAGRAGEAAALAEEAAVLFERKGNVVSAAQARALLAEPAADALPLE